MATLAAARAGPSCGWHPPSHGPTTSGPFSSFSAAWRAPSTRPQSQRGGLRCRSRSGRRAAALRVSAVLQQQDAHDLTSERSDLITKEVVLGLFQLELDAQLQRALTYERFDQAQEVRARRQQVDTALRELQEIKGWGCGARLASKADQLQYAPSILGLKSQMAEAVAAEDYASAAQLRDRLRMLEAAADRAAASAAEHQCGVAEPAFALGEMVVHSTKGYRGVICGWDVACCEGEEWQAAAGVLDLQHGPNQLFYHVLVDARDWPEDPEAPPLAYVAEECLCAASSPNFSADLPLVDGMFEHPFSYLLFLGADGQGNLLPCKQLRDKYCAPRRDVYAPGESRWEEEGGGGRDGAASTSAEEGGGGAGTRRLPGIDMRSLE